MNKATRTFIWGLIIFLTFLTFGAVEWHGIKAAADPSGWQYFWLAMDGLFAMDGLNKISKVTY